MKHHITIQNKRQHMTVCCFVNQPQSTLVFICVVEANKHALDEQKMECIFNICNLSGSHCTEIRQEFTLNLVFL